MSTIPSSPQLHPPGGGCGRGGGAFASSPRSLLVWCSFPVISHDPPGVAEVMARAFRWAVWTRRWSEDGGASVAQRRSWKRRNPALEHLHLLLPCALLQPACTCPSPRSAGPPEIVAETAEKHRPSIFFLLHCKKKTLKSFKKSLNPACLWSVEL